MAITGAVLNAAAFTGSNYLAKYLAGDNGKAALDEPWRLIQSYKEAEPLTSKDSA